MTKGRFKREMCRGIRGTSPRKMRMVLLLVHRNFLTVISVNSTSERRTRTDASPQNKNSAQQLADIYYLPSKVMVCISHRSYLHYLMITILGHDSDIGCLTLKGWKYRIHLVIRSIDMIHIYYNAAWCHSYLREWSLAPPAVNASWLTGMTVNTHVKN